MLIEKFPEIQKLSSEDKIELALELWNDAEHSVDTIPKWQDQLLDERLKEYEEGKMKFYSLEEVKQKLGMK